MSYSKVFAAFAVFAFILAGPAKVEANDDGTRSTDYSGLYIGMHAGHAWGERDGCIDVFDLNNACDGIIPPIPFSYDQDGFFGGAQIGYNYQVNGLLIGAELEASLGDIEGVVGTGPIGGPGEYSWMAAAKLRVGWNIDDLLVFATGGLAVADFEYQGGLGCAFEQTRSGYLIGGGAEYKLTKRASVKLEYNYRDFGKEDSRCTVLGFIPSYVETNAEIQTLTIGLNYSIGGP